MLNITWPQSCPLCCSFLDLGSYSVVLMGYFWLSTQETICGTWGFKPGLWDTKQMPWLQYYLSGPHFFEPYPVVLGPIPGSLGPPSAILRRSNKRSPAYRVYAQPSSLGFLALILVSSHSSPYNNPVKHRWVWPPKLEKREENRAIQIDENLILNYKFTIKILYIRWADE